MVGHSISRYGFEVVAPYRSVVAKRTTTARTRDGLATLEVGPNALTLEIPERARLAVAGGFVTVESREPSRFGKRKKTKKARYRLGGTGLLAARAHLLHDLGLWIEEKPGMVRRIFGFRRVEGLDQDAIDSWAELDALGVAIAGALRDPSAGERRALELGRGGHRVLFVERKGSLQLFARPLFRERPRLVAELDEGAELRLPRHKNYEPVELARTRYAVVHAAERIVFTDKSEREAGAVFLPWIAESDRDELARRFGAYLEESG